MIEMNVKTTSSEMGSMGESSPYKEGNLTSPASVRNLKLQYLKMTQKLTPPVSAISSDGEDWKNNDNNASIRVISKTRSFFKPHSAPTAIDFRRRAKTAKMLKNVSLLKAVKANYPFIYRINDGIGTTNTMLQKVCEERGWKEFRESSLYQSGITPYERAMRGATGWNLWWSYSMSQFSPYKYLRTWQFTNHNPKGFHFCNKLYLTMFIRKMEAVHGSIFDFYPLSFIIPDDYLRLSTEHFKRAGESFTEYNYINLLGEKPISDSFTPVPSLPQPLSSNYIVSYSPYTNPQPRPRTSPTPSNPSQRALLPVQVPSRFNPVWISKPVALSQGKGIYLTTDVNNMATDKKAVVQEYITRPFLIGGYKWDLRIYVCVAAIDPLVIYMYEEGLCRFCTEKYCANDLARMYSHLTNASLNKFSPSYEDDKELIGQGCKWPLRKLRQHLKDKKINDWLMWQKIMTMVVLTVIGDSLKLGYSASNKNCFDLFGFDVIVDENLKPWLLECNYSPGLGGDSATDLEVKKPMLHDLFDLLGFPGKNSDNALGETASASPLKTALSSTNHKTSGDKHKTLVVYTVEDEEVVPYDKEELARHYFSMLLSRLNLITDPNSDKERKARWMKDNQGKAKARLNDAKSIYSQNLVVQYLKNQSSGGKLSKQLRDQLIAEASKKIHNTMTVLTRRKKDKKRPGPSSVTPKETTPGPNEVPNSGETEVKYVFNAQVPDENNNNGNCDINSEVLEALHVETTLPSSPSELQGNRNIAPLSDTSTTASIVNKLKQEFPAPDSEEFQKLKHYFDAAVDFPVDAKTGKFKDCPALISVKNDWAKSPKRKGGWIRVYPFDATTAKSPYKNSLADVKQCVRSVDAYIKVAEELFTQHPTESDDFYRRKLKTLCRRDTDIWTPPTPIVKPNQPTTPTPSKPPKPELQPPPSAKSSSTMNEDTGPTDLKTRFKQVISNTYCWRTPKELIGLLETDE